MIMDRLLKIKIPLIIVLFVLKGCATNPVTGNPDFVVISEQQEISIGANYHERILEESKILDDKELNDYIQKLGTEIARKSHRPNLKWKFTIIDSPQFNAFATPGGYVYMYRGMLNYFNSEAELVGVLGHEIGHITARHAVRGMSNAQITNLLLGVIQANVPGSQLTNNAFSLLNVAINRGYGRKYELEADQLGAEYLLINDYDPTAMSGFLEIMKQSDELEKVIAKSENRPPNVGYHGIFSTHPDSQKRINALKEDSENKENLKTNKERFLKLLDGSNYGTSPEEGYVKDSVFYHPIFEIRFDIDDEWAFKNLPDRLELTKDGDQIVMRADDLLKDDLDNGLTPEQYLKNGVKESGFLNNNELIDQKIFSFNNLNGFTHLYKNETPLSTYYKRFIIIFDLDTKDIKPKAWISSITMSDLKNDDSAKQMLESFKKMTKEEIANSKGLKIKVVRFREGMSYESLAKSSPLGKFAKEKLMLLNGHYPEGNPEVGDLIKIVQ